MVPAKFTFTFEKDKFAVRSLVGGVDAGGQALPELLDLHGVALLDLVVPQAPEPAVLPDRRGLVWTQERTLVCSPWSLAVLLRAAHLENKHLPPEKCHRVEVAVADVRSSVSWQRRPVAGWAWRAGVAVVLGGGVCAASWQGG